MRRVFTDTSVSRARPSKRFCPPLTHSLYSDLSHPRSGFWCAEKDHLRSISVWQSRDVSGFLPLLPVPPSPMARVIGDTFGFLPQPTGPILATLQPKNKDANFFPLWWMTSPPLGAFRHPNTGMSSRPQHSAPSIAFLSRMGASTRGIVLGSLHSSVRLHTPVGLQSPLLRRGSSDSSKQHLKGFCAATGAVLPPSKKG